MADPDKMKIIIRYCLPWGNFSTQVIYADFDTDVSDLRLDIEKKFSIKPRKQVLKYKRDALTLKLLPGWPLSHFGITDKAIVYLENLESQSDDEGSELYNRDATKGGYFAKLGILNKIEEEEEDEERMSRHSSAMMSFSPSFPNMDLLSGESGSSDDESTGPPPRRKGSYFMQKQLSPVKGKEDIEGLIRETKASHLENIQEILKNLQTAQKEEEKGKEPKKSPKEIIDQRGEQGWNSLHWAIYTGNSEIVNEFLKYKPDINLTTSDGWTPLQLAVYKNQATIMKALFKEDKLKVNQETAKTTALHIAAKNGKAQLVTMLLEQGANPSVKSNDSTAYDVAANDKIKKILQVADSSKPKKIVVEAEPAQPAKPPVVKGMIFKKSEHLMKMNRRYIVLNPHEGTLIQYIKKEDYPNKPRRVIPLKSLKEVKRKKAGLFDKNLHFIQLTYKKSLIFGCYQEDIANTWVEHINKAIAYSKTAEDQMQNEISMYVEDKVPNMRSDFGEPTEEIELEDVKGQVKSNGSRKSSNNEENSQNITKDASPDSGSSSDKEAEEAKESAEQFNQLVADEKVSFSSFEIMKELGAGAFGKVFKVRKKDNKKIFALKALRKRPLIVQRQLKYALTEANVLKRANNPFVLGLHYAFQTREYMYFVLDYCPGGDLSLQLIDKGTFTEDEARFYVAELILAIEYLHSIDVIYRDLKPENILIARDGHIKLADFGLSKEGVADKDLAKSFCGSPAYLSPEMLKNKGVGKAADIYGIGTVLYEMLIGESPYYSDDIPELYSKINKAKLEIPKTLSLEARNLLTKLLHKNPSHRIGVKDKAELKNDPFFKGINWTRLARKEIEPPKLNILEDDETDMTVDPRSIFNDMDYNENEIKTNRVKNFTFIKKANYF